jgi:hypothetical protein
VPLYVITRLLKIPRSEFVRSFQDVLVDPSGAVNILADWTKGEIELVRLRVSLYRPCIDGSCDITPEKPWACWRILRSTDLARSF